MPYTYTTLVNALQIEAVQLASDTNWTGILPTIIDDAEQRCYRELDLLSTVTVDNSASTTINQRSFTLPQSIGRFVVVTAVNVFNGTFPAGRTPLNPLSLHTLNAFYPAETPIVTPSVPKYFAPLTDQTILLGPSPSSVLRMEIIGPIRPNPLTASNPTTFLTNFLSDLFFAACMCSAAGYMRNYGSQADDPKMAQSWEQQYAMRMASAQKEEMRRKFSAGGWASQSDAPSANTPR